MSEDTKTGTGAPRRTSSIDLPKSAVKDLTPREDAAEAPAGEAKPKVESKAAEQPGTAAEPAPPPAKAGGSSLPVLGGAVAGALFGLLGAVGYQNLAAPPVTVADPLVHKLREDTGAIQQKLREDMAALNLKVIEARETEQRLTQAFEQKLAAQAAAQLRDVEARATALDQKAIAAEQRAAVAEQKGAALEKLIAAQDQKAATLLAPVDDRLKAAEARIGEGRDSAAAMAKRIDLLAQIEPPRVDLRPIITKIDELDRAIGSTAARTALGGDVAQALDGRIKTIEQGAGGLGQSLKGVEQSLKSLDQAVADLKARPAPVDIPAARLAVAGMTRRALDAGEALGPLVTTLGALGVAQPQVAALARYAEAPMPRLPALADQAARLAATAAQKAAAAAAPPAAAQPGLLDRVTSTLLSQVEVKKTGETTVQPTGVAAQVKALLTGGDATGALAALNALPADQRDIFKPVAEALAARAAAYDSLRTIERDALAAVARKG